MNDQRDKVFVKIDGVYTHIGYANEPDEGGARTIDYISGFDKSMNLGSIKIQAAEKPEGMTIETPLLRSDLKGN